jgi:hypothetical protein
MCILQAFRINHSPPPKNDVVVLQECDAFQGECLREESRYHYLHALMGILDVHTDKVGTPPPLRIERCKPKPPVALMLSEGLPSI